MLFNSLEFAVFLPVVFLLYWFAVSKDLKLQNLFLLAASYIFYGWWDYRFLVLLISVSLFNYFTGIRIDKSGEGKGRKRWLITGIIINLAVLAVFKYFNFFVDTFIDLFSLAGYNLPKTTTQIILPLGISFYTFLSLSYIIDIYRKNIAAEKSLPDVFLTLSFFPIILAGPIQRPASLLPQVTARREFSYDVAADGLRQILWGLFAKIVIADNLSPIVDQVFLNYGEYTGSTLLLGIIFFAVQIYADFSGYSNIAIGVGKLFGFRLMQNFAYPYFSRDIAEFWKKWHISLTTWFRDYLFLPLSFSIAWRIKKEKVLLIKADNFIYIVASFVTWSLTGLWHGASYTFLIWGMLNGIFLIVFHLQNKPRKKLLKKAGIKNNHPLVLIPETIITICFILAAWIFFRSENTGQALSYLQKIASLSLFTFPVILSFKVFLLIPLFLVSEWIQKNKEHALQITPIGYRWMRWSIYTVLIFIILMFGGGGKEFIYFQF